MYNHCLIDKLFNFREYICAYLRILEQCFDEVPQFLRPEVLGEQTGAVGPVALDVFEGTSKHEDQLLKLYPGLYVCLHVGWSLQSKIKI